MSAYYIMRSVCMQAHCSHMSLVYNRHHRSRMHLVAAYLVLCYAYNDHTSRRDHMHKTRCCMYSRDRSRRTFSSSRLCMMLLYYTDISTRSQR